MYLTYAEYQTMGGTLAETEFNVLERDARMLIDDITFKRLQGETTYPDEVKECMFNVIRSLDTANKILASSVSGDEDNLQIKSRSNDGVSVSYNVIDAADVYVQSKKDAESFVRNCLFKVRNSKGYRLTYRGLYPDE